jgi:pectate lyase-like protein
MDAFISPNDTGGVMKLVDSSTVVDNIFVFTDGTDKFQWTNNRKGVYPLSQAKILAGDSTDKTSILQAVLNHADIKVVELDAQQVITISGTLTVPDGKIIRFTNGSKFTGTATIKGATIDADYSYQIFDTSITLRECKLTRELFSVKWFGALGNGIADDQPAIQKAGDTIIFNQTRAIIEGGVTVPLQTVLPKTLYFPPGTYRLAAPLIFHNWNGTYYSFFSLNLLGAEAADFNGTAGESIIDASGLPNTFAIGYQMARSSVIKGLVIRGVFNPDFSDRGGYRGYVGTPYADWTIASTNNVRDNRYSPYSGIVIDPFRNTDSLTQSDRYPGLESYYRGISQYAGSGSSAVRIEECRISGFTVDIMLSPNGQTQQAENVHVIDCTLEVAKAAYASGQDQTKDNFIVRCKSWDRVHTLIDTMSYGAGSGQPPYVDGWNVAGDVIEIYRLFPLRTQCSFRNIFAESLWRVGTGDGGTGLTIYDSAFNFNQNTNPIIFPPTHIEGSKVKFKNCVLKYYDNEFNRSIRVKGPGYAFEDCEFDRPPILDYAYKNENIISATFRNCRSALGTITDFHAGSGFFSTPAAAPYVAYGNITLHEGAILNGQGYNYISDIIIRLNAAGSYQREVQLGTLILTVNDANRTGIITSSDPVNHPFKYQIAIGDYLIRYDGSIIGRVSSVDRTAGIFNIVDIPIDTTADEEPNVAVCWAETAYGQFIGNIAQGSPVITFCEFDVLLPKPYKGQRLKIGNTLYPLIIDEVNENKNGTGLNEIVMSGNSTYTEEKAFNPALTRTPDVAPLEFTSIYTPEELADICPWPVLIPVGAKMNTRRNAWTTVGNDTYISVKPGFLKPSAVSPVKFSQAIFDMKSERATDAIYFTVGDAGFPAASDTTYTNSRFIDRNVVVFRNFVPQFNANPGGGATYITKTFSSDTITFSTALTAGEKIMIIAC